MLYVDLAGLGDDEIVAYITPICSACGDVVSVTVQRRSFGVYARVEMAETRHALRLHGAHGDGHMGNVVEIQLRQGNTSPKA